MCFLKKINNYSLSFLMLNLYIIIQIFLPKNFSQILNIPVRLALSIVMLLVFVYDIKKKNIALNKNRSIGLIALIITFSIVTIPSIIVSKSVVVSIYTLLKFVTSFTLLAILYRIKFTKEEYLILLKNFILCTFILCIMGVLFYLFGYNLMVKFSGIEFYQGAKGRLNVTFFNTIYYGIFLNTIFPIVFYLIFTSNKKSNKIILSILGLLVYINLALTFTRSAILVFFMLFLLLSVIFYKKILSTSYLFLTISIVVSSLLIPGVKELIVKAGEDSVLLTGKIFVFLPIDNKSSNVKIKYQDYDKNNDFIDPSLQHRESFANISKRIARDNLLTGVGFGTYIDYMNSEEFSMKYPEFKLPKTHPHSSLLLVFSETGVFGLLLIMLILLLIILKPFMLSLKTLKDDKYIFRLSSVGFITCIGYLVVNFISENAIYDTQVNNLFIVILGLILGYCYNNHKSNKVLFISSTGGHLSEMLQLKPLFRKYNSYLITEKTKSTKSLKNKFPHVNYLLYGTKDHRFSYIFKFFYNVIKSFILYILIQPDVIISTGTHTAVPSCYIGKLFGSKIIFIETFANSKTKTLSGKIIYPIADTFIVQWKDMLKLYPKAIYGGWIY